MFGDLYYHKDTGLLPALARNLWSLKLILGAPRLTLSIGKYSQQTLKMVKSIEESFGSSSSENETGALIVMDRSFDLASTLLTSVTYLGLLSEVVDIKSGTATLGGSQTKLDPNKDHVYGDVRDRHFSDAFPTLRAKAKLLKCTFLFFQIRGRSTNSSRFFAILFPSVPFFVAEHHTKLEFQKSQE